MRIDSCIPSEWNEYTVISRFRGACYRIEIINPAHVCRGIKQLSIDGKCIDGNVLPVFNDGETHIVKVELS